MQKQYTDEEIIQSLPGFTHHYMDVNGTNLHYVKGGEGDPLILIPGYPETWWAYRHVMPKLAKKYTVIVVEIRGMGASSKPADGYDKKNMAKDIYELVQKLGYPNTYIGGHDIGAHVAYSFAVNYPESTRKLMLLDTPHPDPSMYNLPMLPILNANYLYPWWLAFNQVKDLPEQILAGRMNIVIDWFFEHLVINKNAFTDLDKAVYIAAYNSKEAIRSANAWYQAFPQDIEDSKTYHILEIPVIGIGGSGFPLLQMSLPNLAQHFQLHEIKDSGHFILSEKPEETVNIILDFLAQ